MLKELSQYENLGSPKFFFELFSQIRSSQQPWSKDDVRGYFYNRIVDGQVIFDGCLSLAEIVGAIAVSDEGLITLNDTLESSLVNERYLSNRLLEMILLTVRGDDVFHNIFSSQNISYDVIYRLIQIEGSAFSFRYSCFRKLLVDFDFLYPHPDRNIKKLIVNSKYKKLFDTQIMPEIKRRKIGVSELEKALEQKQIYGAEAESFVLNYERGRLGSHSNLRNVEIISGYDVAAGYDVVSYNNIHSTELDRFIEVKSFSSIPSFHWSRNEIDVARVKRERYYLYLVDREKMTEADYSPIIIQNPYEEILENDVEWNKRVDSYFVIKNI